MRRIAIAVAAGVLALLAGCAAEPAAPPSAAQPSIQPSIQPTAAPVLTADTIDDVFLSTIRAESIGTTDDERELRRAEAVCTLLDDGTTYRQLITALTSNGFTAGDAGFFAGAATAAYCPEHSHKLHA